MPNGENAGYAATALLSPPRELNRAMVGVALVGHLVEHVGGAQRERQRLPWP